MAEVTGRDDYIMWQALIYAIAAIDSLPVHERELSNQEDMRLLLAVRFPDAATDPAALQVAQRVRKRFGLAPVTEVL